MFFSGLNLRGLRWPWVVLRSSVSILLLSLHVVVLISNLLVRGLSWPWVDVSNGFSAIV